MIRLDARGLGAAFFLGVAFFFLGAAFFTGVFFFFGAVLGFLVAAFFFLGDLVGGAGAMKLGQLKGQLKIAIVEIDLLFFRNK